MINHLFRPLILRGRRLAPISLFVALLLLGCIALAGEGYSKHSTTAQLKQYINAVKLRPAQKIEPMPEFSPTPTYTYNASALRNPFARYNAKKYAANTPNLHREKEALESFPLDSLRMVGTLYKNKKIWALIKTPQGDVKYVTLGNYMGKNFGQIIKIEKAQMQIQETVPRGETWGKRETTIVINS